MEKTDCFGIQKNGRCRILLTKLCSKGNCPFYKSKTQFIEEQEKYPYYHPKDQYIKR